MTGIGKGKLNKSVTPKSGGKSKKAKKVLKSPAAAEPQGLPRPDVDTTEAPVVTPKSGRKRGKAGQGSGKKGILKSPAAGQETTTAAEPQDLPQLDAATTVTPKNGGRKGKVTPDSKRKRARKSSAKRRASAAARSQGGGGTGPSAGQQAATASGSEDSDSEGASLPELEAELRKEARRMEKEKIRTLRANLAAAKAGRMQLRTQRRKAEKKVGGRKRRRGAQEHETSDPSDGGDGPLDPDSDTSAESEDTPSGSSAEESDDREGDTADSEGGMRDGGSDSGSSDAEGPTTRSKSKGRRVARAPVRTSEEESSYRHRLKRLDKLQCGSSICETGVFLLACENFAVGNDYGDCYRAAYDQSETGHTLQRIIKHAKARGHKSRAQWHETVRRIMSGAYGKNFSFDLTTTLRGSLRMTSTETLEDYFKRASKLWPGMKYALKSAGKASGGGRVSEQPFAEVWFTGLRPEFKLVSPRSLRTLPKAYEEITKAKALMSEGAANPETDKRLRQAEREAKEAKEELARMKRDSNREGDRDRKRPRRDDQRDRDRDHDSTSKADSKPPYIDASTLAAIRSAAMASMPPPIFPPPMPVPVVNPTPPPGPPPTVPRPGSTCWYCKGDHFLRNCPTFPGCGRCGSKSHSTDYCGRSPNYAGARQAATGQAQTAPGTTSSS